VAKRNTAPGTGARARGPTPICAGRSSKPPCTPIGQATPTLLYWLTGTGASAARSYWEAYGPDVPAAGREPLPPPSIPVGFTTFPGEIWRTPRSWVEASYPNVIYFNEVDKGGHFAAWEEPELFSTEVRAAFRSLR
jgi:pimeloyl-ACP methyl ester carboxylesterase